jgi:transcriptional regulator with GAF, ATPase, and Fis domain
MGGGKQEENHHIPSLVLGDAMTFDGMSAVYAGKKVSEFHQLDSTEIWREACRHIEIAESTRTISGILSPQMPVWLVLVRRIDPIHGCVETVGVGQNEAEAATLPPARSDCSAGDMNRLLSWTRRGRIFHRVCQTDEELPVLVPSGIEGDVLVGPLGSSEEVAGLLILVAQPGVEFSPWHESLVESLLEPFSTALENDRRLRQTEAMRAAAEADKRSLLTRLGRTELGDTIVGVNSGLRGVMERSELVARSNVPVLVLGETGTGKEVVARVIHTHSDRRDGPFLRVNCGAIPMELVDSQLFGHEKGSFTGAVETHHGWFERAHGGTLLLDEVGELPLAAQVRLLRILQDGWLERVGGHQAIHVDVRIVAATHRDLATMVAQGKFREDLWYRIAVFPILLPPLRERREDIAQLASHFAERAATRFVLPLALPTPEDIQRLTSYSWPGNIRELASVIDRAAILGNGKRLEIATALGSGVPQPNLPAATAAVPAAPPFGSTFASLDEAMRKHIESALMLTRGRIEGRRGAAALLKINPHTLRARMRKLKIQWNKYRIDD